MAPDTSAAGGGQKCFTGHPVCSRWRLEVQRHCTQHTDLDVNCSSPARTVEEIHHKVAPPTTCYREHVFFELGLTSLHPLIREYTFPWLLHQTLSPTDRSHTSQKDPCWKVNDNTSTDWGRLQTECSISP